MLGFAVGLYWTQRRLKNWCVECEDKPPWYQTFRTLMLYLLPAAPIALGMLAALGYYFTAEELSSRAVLTVLAMVSIALAAGLFSRLLLIAQFGIKLRELKRNEDGQISSEETIDIGEITGQLNRLIRATALVGVVLVGWQIWEAVLPAIGYLDKVDLWSGVATKVNGVAIPKMVTLRELLMAIGFLVLAFVLSANLPGLLEVTLLDRLNLDRGGRYAVLCGEVLGACGWYLFGVSVIGFCLASRTVVGGWFDGGVRLWFARDFCEFGVGDHYFDRTTDSSW